MLRDYQQAAIEATFASFSNIQNPLIVAPTGSGKSHIIANFIDQALRYKEDTKFLILTHRAELIDQNIAKMSAILKDPGLIGVYAASRKCRDVNQITFASIQSYVRHQDKEFRDLVLIDECHLVPKKGEGMYQKALAKLKETNPRLRVVGLTATPFRLDSGLLIEGEGRIFDGISYEISLKKLMDRNFLTKLISKEQNIGQDILEIPTRSGDFIMSAAAERMTPDSINKKIASEIIRQTQNRKSVLIFCCNLEHCEKLSREIPESVVATGEMNHYNRARIIADFKAGRTKYLINCELFTTGFDAPNCDCVAILRPTKSVALFCQIVGRGLRIAENKKNCLILDFGGNLERFGPIDLIEVESKDGKAKSKKAPTKKCPFCQSILALGARECLDCGHIFTREENAKLFEQASRANIIATTESYDVINFDYRIHKKEGKPDSLRVSYTPNWRSGFEVSEFICFEHGGYATFRAHQWWRSRGGTPPMPATTREAYERSRDLLKPEKLNLKKDGKYWRILDVELVQEKDYDPFDFLGVNI